MHPPISFKLAAIMEPPSQETALRFECYEARDAKTWKEFLAQSNNGTLFHDLDFLAYHPEGKFETHHLMIYQDKTLVALFPAAIVEKSPGHRVLQSPYGASIGGCVVSAKLKVGIALEIVGGLQAYAQRMNLTGIELRLAPNSYMREPNDLFSFTLQIKGFHLEHSSLVFMVPLHGPREGLVNRLLSATKRHNVRSSLKKGLFVREVDQGKLTDFYAILIENHSRHGTTPTHTLAELENLFQLVPGKLRLFLCQQDGVEIAGILVFILNEITANTFYVCERQSFKREFYAPAVLHAYLIDKMAEEGFRYLDLGPSISDTHHNQGTVFFKESMGAQGFSRETLSWTNGASV